MTDRLDLTNAIEAAGIERKAAEHLAATIFDAIRENVATKADLAELRAEMHLIEHRLLTRLGGLVVVVAGLLFAALHYWPPHG
ncbi:MAG: hypothetical protein ACRET2_09320 [Steroidobacteraceae bacterium]